MATDRPRPDPRQGLLGTAVILALAVGIAGLAASHALGQILLRDNPQLALRLDPGNGEARARKAWLEFVRTIDPKKTLVPSSVPHQTESEAKRAFEAEPTSTSALRILALAAQREGLAPARKLMRMAGGLTKRDQVIDLWLILDFAKSGELKPLLSHLDYLLRTQPELHEKVMPLLVGELRNPAATPTMTMMLRRRPAWGENFWNYVLLNPDVAVNAARLRRQLGEGYEAGPPQFNAQLIDGLVSGQRYREAFRTYAILSRHEAGPLVRDPNFDKVPVYPPLEWQVLAEGAFVADLDPKAGELTLSSDSAAPTVFARQLVRLAPGGPLRLRSKWHPNDPNLQTSLNARLRCADTGAAMTSAVLPKGDYSQNMRAPAGCVYAWLEVVGQGRGEQFEATMQTLDLVPLATSGGNRR